jgi:hypothetical protein
MKASQAFETQGTIYPTTPRKTPDELNVLQKRREKRNLAVCRYSDTQNLIALHTTQDFIMFKISRE